MDEAVDEGKWLMRRNKGERKKTKRDESFKRFQSQGQGQRNEHEHVWHPYVYRHAKFECNSFIKYCMGYCKLKSSKVSDTLVTTNESQGNRNGKGHLDL